MNRVGTLRVNKQGLIDLRVKDKSLQVMKRTSTCHYESSIDPTREREMS